MGKDFSTRTDLNALIERLKRQRFYQDQIVHREHLPQRPAQYADAPSGLHPAVARALNRCGIERLYTHQADAIARIRQGKSVVIVTGTASGKTLCYNIPVVERILSDPTATALMIYPTKALTQDQLRGLARFEHPDLGIRFLAGPYDGDTPADQRRRLRDSAHVILTNPDMLHQGILPNHARWNRFFSNLKFVVLDEVHAYRGVFGSHLANVLRRLHRICRHYGSAPQFICCSATIGNPAEHAARIVGEEVELIDRDGSPRGPRRFLLWNPPLLSTAAVGTTFGEVGGDRRSPLWEAVNLIATFVQEGIQTIAFVRTRLAAELIFKNTRDLLKDTSRRLAQSVHAYRGGYLPEERRQIERRLVERQILGIASTNALELGIDIGTLDACLLVGYPGTIASLWQRAGRAGRSTTESLIVLIAQNSPIDQYLMLHPEYLFSQSVEQAVIDPDNPHIVVGHIQCAVHELPVPDEEVSTFGQYAPALLDLLQEQQSVRHIEGQWHWATTGFPAAEINLRNIAGPVYTIQESKEGVIGTMDELSALSQLHDHAVYLHEAETYIVTRLDLEHKIAHVEKRDLDYYTQAIQASQLRLDEREIEQSWRGCAAGFGEVTVTTTIPMFKKIRFHSRDSLGFETLELPPQELQTVALWLSPPRQVCERLLGEKLPVGEALLGVANVLVQVAPVYVMCDEQDIGALVDASNLGRDALFLYDRYPGGMGYARRCLDRLEELMQTVHEVIANCRCAHGCPSCVGAALPAFATTDLDSAARDRIPNKHAARLLLDLLLAKRLPANPAP